jgi:deferrochelatase/peroxidase EfeB
VARTSVVSDEPNGRRILVGRRRTLIAEANQTLDPGAHGVIRSRHREALEDRARFLTAGGDPADLGVGAPPSDSGLLGPSLPADDGLSVTVGVGASLFDQRYGLANAKPARLTVMRSFPNDNLDPAQFGGDLSLQICAARQDTVLHALRDIARHTRGGMQIRWRIDGFQNPPRPSGAQRNLMGSRTAPPTLMPARPPRWIGWSGPARGNRYGPRAAATR